MGIENDYIAYCFDEAVATWGQHVTAELEKIDGKTEVEVTRKRHHKLLQLLQVPDSKRFRSLRKPKK